LEEIGPNSLSNRAEIRNKRHSQIALRSNLKSRTAVTEWSLIPKKTNLISVDPSTTKGGTTMSRKPSMPLAKADSGRTNI